MQDPDCSRDFVHASDVIKMVELCLGNEKAYGQAFNCGTGKAISVSELAKIINELTGNEAGVEHGESRKGDILHSQADITKAEELLGYQPTVNLKDGLAGLI